MSPEEYKLKLSMLGLSQSAFGTWVGVHPVTAKKWAADGPPVLAEKWLRYLTAKKITPQEVDAAIRRAA